MREFFHGWKRKAGIFMLGLACLLTAGWVRSLTDTDLVFLPIGKYCLVFTSIDRHFGLLAGSNDSFGTSTPEWESSEYQPLEDVLNEIDDESSAKRWQFCGFQMMVNSDPSLQLTILFCPYLSIVAPSIVISALLLMSKPKPSQQPTVPPA